jgi:hypothetical protein
MWLDATSFTAAALIGTVPPLEAQAIASPAARLRREGVQENRANLRGRLRAGHVPQFLLQHCGYQHRAVGADDEVLQEVAFWEVGDRGQGDRGEWSRCLESSS